MTKNRALILADVTLGFAVPQVVQLARSLHECLGLQVTLVEPDMKGRREFVELPELDVRRVSTRNPPHDMVFHIEYVRALREIYQEVCPDVLVVLNAAVIPPLLLEEFKPKFVLYYMLESLDHQLALARDHFFDVNRMATQFIDLVVVPERRRFAVDAARLGWQGLPVIEVLNIGSEVNPRIARPERCKLLFAGTLNHATGFDWLSDPRLAHLDVDVAGPIDSEVSRELLQGFLASGNGHSARRYLGLIAHNDLIEHLHDYAFRLVFWSAQDINSLYASPNKFFESISNFLPPICTPHPQIVEVHREYRCSLVSENFDREAMVQVLLDAERIYFSDGYERLLSGCERAAREKLNWSTQCQPVLDCIETALMSDA